MNGKPIPIPMPLRIAHAPGPMPETVAVDAVIDYLNLPSVRPPIGREDGVHVIVRDGEAFARWVHALGGEVQHSQPLGGAALWSLRTETPRRADDSTVRVWVHIALVAGEFASSGFRGAVSA
ncbi:hypothetical protein [Streptomyces sp. NPDC004042]|uniref:hypothetical protein n=1 Tax=Streptomyces sp. NPDC004042 TaxID=3154451 RepID=UPI0033BF0C81